MIAYILRYIAARLVWSAVRPRAKRKPRHSDDWS